MRSGLAKGSAPVMKTENDALGHDHGDGLTQSSGTRLGGEGAGFEKDEVEDVDTGQKHEVNWEVLSSEQVEVQGILIFFLFGRPRCSICGLRT